jgi:hypothetical protein
MDGIYVVFVAGGNNQPVRGPANMLSLLLSAVTVAPALSICSLSCMKGYSSVFSVAVRSTSTAMYGRKFDTGWMLPFAAILDSLSCLHFETLFLAKSEIINDRARIGCIGKITSGNVRNK